MAGGGGLPRCWPMPGRSVLEGVLDFVRGLLGVAGGDFGASFGPEPAVSGDAADIFLGFSFRRLALCLIFLRMFTVLPIPGLILFATVRQAIDA